MINAFSAAKLPLCAKAECVFQALLLGLLLLFAQAAQASPEIAVYIGSGTDGVERTDNIGVYNFRGCQIGTTSEIQAFTVHNSGTTALSLSGVTLAGDDSNHFILDTFGLAASLAPGDTTTFTIAFRPSKTGLLQAFLQIVSDDEDETPFQIYIAGNGQPAGVHKVVGWGSGTSGQTYAPAHFTDVTALSAGYYHSLVVKSDGTVLGSGWNDFGQASAPSGLAGVMAVSAGSDFSVALKNGGTVVAWGWNGSGESTVPSGLAGVVAVSASRHHTLALKSDGTVVAWGWGGNGECTIPSGLNDAVAVSAGGYFSMALKKDGTVIAWGWNGNGECNIPSGLSGVVAVSAGDLYAAALKKDGKVVAWGSNVEGQCNVPPGLTDVTAIDAGFRHSVALKTDGSVVTWGQGSDDWVKTPSSLKNAVVVQAGQSYCLALGDAPDMAVHAGTSTGDPVLVSSTVNTRDLGASFAGGTGPVHTFTIHNAGTADLQLVTPTLGGADASQFVIGTEYFTDKVIPGGSTSFTVAFRPTNRGGQKKALIQISSNNPTENPFWISVTGVCNSNLALFDGTDTSSGTLTDNVSVRVFRNCPLGASSSFDSLTVKNTGAVPLVISGIALGGKDSSQFALDTSSLTSALEPGASTSFKVAFTPTRIGLQRALIQVATDNPSENPFRIHLVGHGLTTVERPVVAWGSKSYGQLNVPPDLAGAVALTAGHNHALALRQNGTLVAWGNNSSGQVNVPNELDEVVAVAAGAQHSLALKSDGTVVAWGSNSSGQSSVPADLTGVAAISAGAYHSLALKNNGTVVAWGAQGGVPAGLNDVVAITGGVDHSQALKTDGSIVSWGGFFSPPYGLPKAVAMASWRDHGFVLKEDGTVQGWGFSFPGVATGAAGLSDIVSVAAGEYHGLALRRDGTVYGWVAVHPYLTFEYLRVPAGLVGVTAVAAGRSFSLALGQLVEPLSQTIIFDPPTTLYVGQTITLDARASSGLQVGLYLESGPGTWIINQLRATAPGTIKILAKQFGGGLYLPAPSVSRTITVKAAPTTLTLYGLTQIYNGSIKAITVLGNSGPTSISYNGSTTAPANAGKYAVKVTDGTKTVSGTLSIEKAPLWVQAENQRRLVSQPNPALTYTYTGFQGGDTAAVIQSLPTISTTAKITSLTGRYPITTKGGTAVNYGIIHVPGTLVVDGFGTNYEALLSDADGRAAGKLELTLNATCTSFTAKVASALDSTPVTFAGTMTMNVPEAEASGQKTLTNTKSGVTHGLNFTVSRPGILSAVFTRSVGTDPAVTLQSLDGHGRLLLPKPAIPLSYAGAYTLLMEPAQTMTTIPDPSTPIPGGSGWARSTISNAGVLSLTGVLGDGTTFTASLLADTAAKPGYRLFIQPYKPARAGAFLGGFFALEIDPRLSTRKYLPETTLHWAKAAEAKDPSYPEGFANLDVTSMMDPWRAPSKSDSLASLLGLNGSSLSVAHSTTGNSAQDASLPTSLNLSSTTLVVPDAKNNPSKWLTTLNTTTGQLTGSFELLDAVNKRRSVRFTGILRQPVLTGDRLIGGGHFILPPIPGSLAGQKPTTGDLMFLKSSPTP